MADIHLCMCLNQNNRVQAFQMEMLDLGLKTEVMMSQSRNETLVQGQWDPNKMAPVGFASTGVQEKHAAEPRLKIRIKERSAPCSVPALKTKKEPEIIIHTVSDEGSSNDGYRWRKYGQKMLKGNSLVRSYYRCSSSACPARKHVERATDDATSTTITYAGKHDHDKPAPKKMQCSESRLISPAASTDDARRKKNISVSSRKPSSRCSVDGEVDLMGEKLSKLGAEQALESAQTLLSIGIDLRPR
ncbi:WRKY TRANSCRIPTION FACTOR 32-RELATED [Salix koriyanagi]|uniref:WRKY TRANSCRIPTION FACTOR 32-RELATED n=1 Tax=Salix koriyanagi TaxID=2511006 RepID=A0A9Q0W1T7_9ROSI|nr:WRKY TRANSCRIPTION FACTOR 32-RELATED [Salix koriyanagi]